MRRSNKSLSLAGRDKILRTIQYWSRFYSYILFRKGYSKDAILFWKTLQATVGLSRKLFRAGKPLLFLKIAGAQYSNKTQDPILRYTALVKSICYAIYFTTDTITWIQVSKIHNFAHGNTITRMGAGFWLIGLIANLINSLRRHQIATAKEEALLAESEKDTSSLKRVVAEKKASQIQFLWDALDCTIPISSLQIADLDDGLVGLAGLTSSVLGTKAQWAATY